jgi:hypothetical protein
MSNCPVCKVSWIGEEIPLDIREHYSPPYHWYRQIGIDGGLLGIYDGVVAYQCPDCKAYVPVSESSSAKNLFSEFMRKFA